MTQSDYLTLVGIKTYENAVLRPVLRDLKKLVVKVESSLSPIIIPMKADGVFYSWEEMQTILKSFETDTKEN